MGKSTCAGLLKSAAVPVIDTDDLAREVVEPGQPALVEIEKAFGSQVLDANRALRRDVLAGLVFSDPKARVQLENILHPRIRHLWHDQTAKWKTEGQPCAVVVIPLLFETRAENEFNATICLACSPATQSERLQARGWSPLEIAGRLDAQLPVTDKISRSDFVIWTEGSLEVHSAQLHRILSHFGRE